MNRATEAAFEATETSSISALSRGTSIGAQESSSQLAMSHTELGYKAEDFKPQLNNIINHKPQA